MGMRHHAAGYRQEALFIQMLENKVSDKYKQKMTSCKHTDPVNLIRGRWTKMCECEDFREWFYVAVWEEDGEVL